MARLLQDANVLYRTVTNNPSTSCKEVRWSLLLCDKYGCPIHHTYASIGARPTPNWGRAVGCSVDGEVGVCVSGAGLLHSPAHRAHLRRRASTGTTLPRHAGLCDRVVGHRCACVCVCALKLSSCSPIPSPAEAVPYFVTSLWIPILTVLLNLCTTKSGHELPANKAVDFVLAKIFNHTGM